MVDDFKIAKLSTELEEAGWLGIAAAAALGLFIGMEGTPGAISSTGEGFVWSKTLHTGAEGKEFGFGIGKIKVATGLFSATLGASWSDGGISDISLMLTFLDGQAVGLEIDQKYAKLARRVEQTNPDGSKELIAYSGPYESLLIDLPTVALEFNFRLRNGKLVSAVQIYESLSAIADLAMGVIPIPFPQDKVLVVPDVLNVGFVFDDLFIDLSSTGAADFVSRFPEAYNADWKGIGAKEVSIIIPTERENDTFTNFIVAQAEGFLLEFGQEEMLFSGKCAFRYTASSGLLRQVDVNIDIRNDQIVRGELSVITDFITGVEKTKQKTENETGSGTNGPLTTAANEGQTRLNEKEQAQADAGTNPLPDDGLVQFTGALVKVDLEGRSVFGIELMMDNLVLPNQTDPFVIDGMVASWTYWLTGLGLGVYYAADGISEEDAGRAAFGMGLINLMLIDIAIDDRSEGQNSVLPHLKALKIRRLGVRIVDIEREGQMMERVIQAQMDIGLRFRMDCLFTDLIGLITSLGMSAFDPSFRLFDVDLDALRMAGHFELAIENIVLGGSLDPELARLFNVRPMHLTAKELPELILGPREVSGSSKPVVGAKFIIKEEEGQETKFGLSLLLKGMGNASLSVPGAAAGLILYFYPEWSIDLAPQLTNDPKFHFLLPPIAYLEGIIDLNKPIPGLNGTQNRVSVDVGFVNSKVKADDEIDKQAMAELRKISNYKVQLGGEVAWGEVMGPNQAMYDFLFAEVHFESKSPLISLGPVGLYGFGGLLGRNIAPGVIGTPSAQGIANWITQDGAAFTKVKNWPPVPDAGGGTWHPDRDWVNDADKRAFGLFIKAGSAGDSGKTAMADTILLLGYPEMWFALAANVAIKPVKGKMLVVIAYDSPSETFFMKFTYTLQIKDEKKVEEDGTGTPGKIVKVKTDLQVVSSPERASIRIGDYRTENGGPAEASLFDLFRSKFYYVIDSKQLDQFGLVTTPEIKRPTIPGPALGFGTLYQMGPLKYGPSWLNIEIFGGLGFNLALSFNPFLVYGDIYAVGYVRIKVIVFKAKLELAARLYGLATTDLFRFAGVFVVRIGLPWPLDDVEESVDFFIEIGHPDIPEPELESSAAAFQRLRSKTYELAEGATVLPIDAVIALQFNKPIYEIDHSDNEPRTRLTSNDPSLSQSPDPNTPPVTPMNPEERITTDFADEKYEVIYKHVVENITVSHRPVGGGLWQDVDEMAASWESPGVYDDSGQPDPSFEPHHVVYLNTLMPPELQFSTEATGRLYDWHTMGGTVTPCSVPVRVCLLDHTGSEPQPDVNESQDLREIRFFTGQGEVVLREREYHEGSYGLNPRNLGRLSWFGTELILPQISRITMPDADLVDLSLRLSSSPDIPAVLGYHLNVDVSFRGVEDLARLRAIVLPDPGSPCGFVIDVAHPDLDPSLLQVAVDVEECVGSGDIIVRFELVATTSENLMEALIISGPYVLLDVEQLEVPPGSSPWPYFEPLSSLSEMGFRLHQFCLERNNNERGEWSTTCIGGCDSNGDPLPPEQSADAIWDNQLLEPDQEYRITYRVRTNGSIEIETQEPPADDPPGAENFVFASDDHGAFQTVYFRTESAPTQEVADYVGFAFPAANMQPLYPDRLAPILTLKYRGLIRKVFAKHHGDGALVSQLVGLDGSTVEPEHVETFPVGSAPLDELLEELAASCLPNAEGFSQLQIEVWERNLDPDTHYSLQVTDTHTEPDTVKHSIGFSTSRHLSFGAHLDHVEALFADAIEIPVSNDAAAVLGAVFANVGSGGSPGFDTLVENVYRKLLLVNGGRLATIYGGVNGEVTAYLVGQQNGQRRVWGMAIELSEPLVGKDGVGVEGVPTSTWTHAGVLFAEHNGQRTMIIRDLSGSRLLLFNSADGQTFAPFQTPVEVSLSFSNALAARTAVRAHVDRAFGHLDKTERDLEVDRVVGELNMAQGVGDMLVTLIDTLRIPLGE